MTSAAMNTFTDDPIRRREVLVALEGINARAIL
jgi:hypothetical protein